jgi:lambda family phage tail tape measure protein
MAKISGIYVEIRGDATQLKRELREARDLVTQQAQGMSNALNNALSPAQLKNSVNGLTRNLNTLANASKLTGKEFGLISADLGKLQRITGVSASEFSKLQSRMMQTSAAKAQEQALRNIAKAANLSTAEVRQLGRQMGVSAASIASVAGASHQAARGLTALSVAGGMVVASVVSELAMLPKAVLDAGIAMDSLQRSFVAITGSQWGAAEMMAYLRGEAGRLGQNFYELAPAFKSLSAAARGTTLEGEETRKIFSAVTAASTALGLSADQTKGTLLALEQMISKGTVSMEELRRQLGDRLPGAFQLAARAMGVSTQELNKMVAEGKVMADDLLPKLATELEKTYGKAAQTSALESAQAAMNRMSEAWTDLKNNLYASDEAVAGINRVTEALKTLAEWANLRSVSKTFAQGAKMAAEGKFDYQQFVQASFIDRQKMVDSGGPLHTWRAKVNRADVRTASAPITATLQAAPSVAGSSSAAREAEQQARAHEKMLADGKKAADALDAYWQDYEDARIQAVAEGVADRARAQEKDLALVAEFAEKHREIVLGETEFKRAQIEAQADVYRKAGADEVAIAQWVEAEKLKVSREWSDGVQRGLADYADSATNAAQLAQDAITGGFKGMEDALVDFVTTGKMNFADFADSVIKDMARIAIQQSITGPLASGAGDFLKYLISPKATGSASTIAFSGVASAKGNVFESAGLHAYANTIVSKPTIFPFARGVGLMGEAGPEAIMPLKRGPDGTLGVRGGGSNVVVNVIESPGNGGQRQDRQEGGTTIIDIMVEQIEAKLASNTMRGQGPLYSANKQAFGLTRAPGAY